MEDEKKSGSEDINLDQTTDFTKAIAEALEPIRKKMDCDKQAIIVCGIDLGINDENNHASVGIVMGNGYTLGVCAYDILSDPDLRSTFTQVLIHEFLHEITYRSKSV